MKSTKTVNAIAYYRVSTKKQGDSGLGLEAQKASVLAYASKNGLTVASEYTEVETGTKKRQRPQIALALAQAKKSNAVLLIAKLDRLARNVAFVSALMESGVEFIAVDMPTANKLTIHIIAAIAEHEAQLISQRTKAALQALKERGEKLGKPENMTHDAQITGAKVNQEKAVKAMQTAAYVAKGLRSKGATLERIASELNDNGYTTRQGKAFTRCTVQRMLDRA